MLVTRLRSLTPRIAPLADRSLASWLVPVVAVGCLIFLVAFVARHASRVPFHDEYANFHLVFAEPTAADFWHQHNEHRIPLPRLVYVAAVRLAGYDFRAPLVLNAALLAAATVVLLAAVRATRGRWAATDAAIPLLLLGTQHFDNLLWGFQVQFMLSTTLVLGAAALAVWPGRIASPSRLALLAGIAAALPLCGANGSPFALALGGFLAVAGVGRMRAGNWSAGAIGVGGGLLAVAVIGATFVGLNRTPHPAPNLPAFLSGLVNLPGFGFGPASYLAHGEAYDGVTAVGVLTALALAGTAAGLLRVAVVDPDSRDRALALAAVIAGVVGLAVGVSYGRSGYPRGVFAGRYVTLFVPGVVALYLAWVLFARGPAGRYLRAGLAVAVALAAVPNARFAAGIAAFHSSRLKRVEYEAKSGLAVGVVADRNPWLFPGEGGARRIWLEMLRARNVAPFASLAADAPLLAETVPVRVLRTDGLTPDAGGYRVDGPQGGVVFALPDRRYVYAVRLTYTATRPADGFPRTVVSWDRDGRIPPAAGYGIIDALDRHTTPAPTVVLIDRGTDTLRIDLFEAGTTFRLDALELLRRPD